MIHNENNRSLKTDPELSQMLELAPKDINYLYENYGTCLVVQWLRNRLPMQGTRVRALVREDPTGCGAAKPVHHNCRACALEPVSHNY
ncbi:hypothetical protein J1605_019093 [Eschrichtius robustus]|uniref:Uncharacterized protein n=1 Tax=Eschrichtius robustus TaxID=9764 RepID=A0AB34HQZ4_ESCRO|nr:hypothetical protein J1605_019093 [Eschrichtius robustus]